MKKLLRNWLFPELKINEKLSEFNESISEFNKRIDKTNTEIIRVEDACNICWNMVLKGESEINEYKGRFKKVDDAFVMKSLATILYNISLQHEYFQEDYKEINGYIEEIVNNVKLDNEFKVSEKEQFLDKIVERLKRKQL